MARHSRSRSLAMDLCHEGAVVLKMSKTISRSDRGAAAIEFAIVVILFLTLIFGIIDGARMVWSYNTLSSAVKMGARFASISGSTSSDAPGPRSSAETIELIKEEIQASAPGLLLTSDGMDVSWEPAGNNQAGSLVKVSATYRFVPITPFMGFASVQMHSHSEMIVLR